MEWRGWKWFSVKNCNTYLSRKWFPNHQTKTTWLDSTYIQWSPSCEINPNLSSILEDLKAAMAWTIGSHIFSLMLTWHYALSVIIMPLSPDLSPPWLTSPPRSPRTCRAQSQAGAGSGPPHTRDISPHWCSFQLLSMKECSGKKVQKIKVRITLLTHPAKKIDQVDSEIKDVG